MASIYVNLPSVGNGHWKAPVAITSSLPLNGNSVGDVRLAEDTNTIYVWTGSAWLAVATPGAAIAIDALLGDVTATGPGAVPATVAFVGGQSAASVAAATALVNGAQSGNKVFASPANGSSGAPAFRALVSADIPPINLASSANGGVTGVLPIANGGTNNAGPFTLGSIIYSDGTKLAQDNANFFWNDSNISLGIGTAVPAANAFIDGINSSGATKRIQITGYGNSVGFRGKYANGTLGSPTAAVNTNVLAFLSAQGYGATGFPAASTALINMTAAGTFTDSSMPTDVNILTTPVGSVTAVQTVLFSHTGATTLGPASSTAVHQINGGIQRTTRTITANLTVDTTTTDDIILCNNSGAISITLPTPTNGRVLVVKDINGNASTNNISIVRHGSENIEGLAATYVFQTNYGSLTIGCDGTNWWLL